MNHPISGAFSGRLDDKLEPNLPRYRRRAKGSKDYVYAFTRKFASGWLVFKPERPDEAGWWDIVTDDAFAVNYVASSREARIAVKNICERRPRFAELYRMNQ